MERIKYTKELLEEILDEGGAVVLEEYERYNQRMYIKFLCVCGKECKKRFEMLKTYRLPYCEGCSQELINKRIRDSTNKKYGVDNVFQSVIVKEKINNTFEQKYGGHPKTTKEVHEKWVATCLEKYGGHPNQNREVQERAEKNSYKFKEYKMPSGKIVKIQGYEDLALDELVKIYTEEDIVIGRGNVPTIKYYIDENKHVYFPDFYIKSINIIIEVKSEWTIGLAKGNVKEKTKATIDAGYKYEIWVYSDKKIKVQTQKFE